MATCDTFLESLIEQTLVQADTASGLGLAEAKISNNKFLKGPMIDFITKCGRPAPACGDCESFFPWEKKLTVPTGAVAYKGKTAVQLRALLKERGLSAKGKKVELLERLLRGPPRRGVGVSYNWGEVIQVQQSAGIPRVYLEIPTAEQFAALSRTQQTRVRSNIKRALEIRDAAMQGVTYERYKGQQAAERAEKRAAKRKERDVEAARFYAKQQPKPGPGLPHFPFEEGESERPFARPERATREEQERYRAGAKPRAPPEPPTEEKGGKQLPKPGEAMKPVWWQGKLIDLATGQETTMAEWHREHGGGGEQ